MIDGLDEALLAAGDPPGITKVAAYLRAVPGGYGYPDEFYAVRVPTQRRIAKTWYGAPFVAADWLDHLRHRVHEHRSVALMVMSARAGRGDDGERRLVLDTYLANTDKINNWDLVDLSCGPVVGGWLVERDAGDRAALLDPLADSDLLWERRIAIVATQELILHGDTTQAYRVAERLLDAGLIDDHDLMHKAVGWTLREAGKRVDADELRRWLARHGRRLPRTTLRYAIERFDAGERADWLARTRP